jgi:hypothetical protein
VARLQQLKWAGHAVAQVDDFVHPSMFEIGKNRLKCKNVAMDIG